MLKENVVIGSSIWYDAPRVMRKIPKIIKFEPLFLPLSIFLTSFHVVMLTK